MYRLTADGQWDDRGTGRVSVEWMEVCCRRLRVVSAAQPAQGVAHMVPNAVARADTSLPWSSSLLVSVQQSNTRGLIVISEDQDTRTLLIHEIQSQDIYQRQGGAQ